MRIKFLILIGLLFANTNLKNEEFYFVSDCINGFSKLHKATNSFYACLQRGDGFVKRSSKIREYNEELISFSSTTLSKHSTSENSLIKGISVDLNKLIGELLDMNNNYLNYITNSDFTKKDLEAKTKILIDKNKDATSVLIDMSFGICLTMLLPQQDKKLENQSTVLTLNQRNHLNEKLITEFGKSISKGTTISSKTYFEYISRRVYDFINKEWEFKKQ